MNVAYWSNMKLPKNCEPVVYFDFNGVWYQVIRNKDICFLYRQEGDNFIQIATSVSPVKLEQRVREGKLK